MMNETAKKPLFNADAAEEYFTNLCTYYRDSRNQIFKKDNEGRNSANPCYSAEYQKLLGKEMAMREVLEYFSKFDLGPSEADIIDRQALIAKINGPDRPEIYDGAQEVEWIMECIQGKAESLDWMAAKEHLDTYEAEYRKLNPLVGTFGLARILDLQERYNRGERTRYLYDDIMSVE